MTANAMKFSTCDDELRVSPLYLLLLPLGSAGSVLVLIRHKLRRMVVIKIIPLIMVQDPRILERKAVHVSPARARLSANSSAERARLNRKTHAMSTIRQCVLAHSLPCAPNRSATESWDPRPSGVPTK